MVSDVMSDFRRVVTLEMAKAILNKKWRARPQDTLLPVSSSFGRVASSDMVSKVDVPPFDRATFDGYAVRASDTFGATENSPIELTLVGRIMAGTWPKTRVSPRSCAEISTGAPLPKGADAVVMSEYAVTKDKKVSIHRPISPGENISKRGSDIKKGQAVLKSLTRLTKIDIAVLAAVGIKKIKVRKKPRVAIISSGSELVKPGDKLCPGKIYDVNSSSLIEAVRACGADPVFIGITPDDAAAIKAAVSKGLKNSGVVLISGGTSVGAGDISPRVINAMGKPGIIVHGLAMKPGKPAFIAMVEGKPIFGLPGYPVSALMVFDQLVADYLHGLSGVLREKLHIVVAKLSTQFMSARGRRELVPVKLIEKNGQQLAEPILKGSGAITSLSTADGYIEIPLEREIVGEGEIVEVKLFEGLHHD